MLAVFPIYTLFVLVSGPIFLRAANSSFFGELLLPSLFAVGLSSSSNFFTATDVLLLQLFLLSCDNNMHYVYYDDDEYSSKTGLLLHAVVVGP